MNNRLICKSPFAKRCLEFAPAACLTLAAVLCVTGCSSKTDVNAQSAALTPSNVKLTQAQRPQIGLYSVASLKYHKAIETTGVVDFDNDQATSVLAAFSGPVSRLLVSLGQHVKQGDPLAIVDSPDFAAAISSYQKARATARTLRHLADLDKDLIQHNGVSKREADQAETDAVNAEADREAALKTLVSLQIPAPIIKDVEEGRPIPHLDGVVRAPIAGTVVEKLITPGQLLQAGTTACFTVADLSRVWVMAQIFGSELTAIGIGDQAEVITGVGGKQFIGTVDNISALVDPDTRSVVARVVVKNPGDFLKKQMYVHVQIQSRQESTGLLVPVSAILRDDVNLPFVYVLQSDDSFARQHVSIGYRAGDQYEITDGVRAGDKIVIDGGIFVQFMQNQ
jgi:membrane fusion protein, heavy metal efflux system